MRRLVFAVLAVAMLPGLVPGASSAVATRAGFSWAIDGSPIGTNISRAADGSRIELAGDGTFRVRGRVATGGGWFRLVDARGRETAAGEWHAVRFVSYDDQGRLLPVATGFRRGLLVLDASFAGLGAGRISVWCHAEPGDVEGAFVDLAVARFDAIEQGSTTLAFDGGRYSGLVDEGGLVFEGPPDV